MATHIYGDSRILEHLMKWHLKVMALRCHQAWTCVKIKEYIVWLCTFWLGSPGFD